jgi:hypothetical protein
LKKQLQIVFIYPVTIDDSFSFEGRFPKTGFYVMYDTRTKYESNLTFENPKQCSEELTDKILVCRNDKWQVFDPSHPDHDSLFLIMVGKDGKDGKDGQDGKCVTVCYYIF